MADLIVDHLDQQATRVIPRYPFGGFMRSSEKFLLSAILGVTLVGCATDSAIGPDDNLRPSMAWSVDAGGVGFVGKGDVQLVFGWNNKALQVNAGTVEFQVNSVVVTEVSWICTKDNDNSQERERTTTTSVQGLLASVARERNQITGFYLEGFDGDPTTSSTSEGNKLNSCPTNWVLTPAGDPEVISSTGGLQVRFAGGDWFDLP